MSILNNSLLLGADAGAAGYQVSRSIRLNASDSAFLSRTPASAGNRKTWTWSGWVKRAAGFTPFYGHIALFSGGTVTGRLAITLFNDTLAVDNSGVGSRATTAVFRDYSAWYHIVVAFDTTNATASDRIKFYINGVQQVVGTTTFTPALNTDYAIGLTEAHNIGRFSSEQDGYFSGYLADIHFIDGQALTPSSFAETNATTGQWVPKAYTGSYGTNGFKLSFSNNASTTTISQDSSGNNNHWTANNISVTAGAGNDSLVDTPTSYGTDTGAGGEVRGNYCTLNPLAGKLTATLSNGNLTRSGTVANNRMGTIGMSSGKWYWEVLIQDVTAGTFIGVTTYETEPDNYAEHFVYNSDGGKYVGTTLSSYGASYGVNDIIGVAYDADSGSLTCYKNGVSQGQLTAGITKRAFPLSRTDGTGQHTFNFGQRPFAYTAPSGFKALCDTNLPAPVVAKPSTVMDVKLYTGNGSTQTISGLGFSPDLVWGKARTINYFNTLQDTVRGAGKTILYSNTTDAENAYNQDWISSFTSDGFDVASGFYNESPQSYVAWCWDAGSSTVTNTQGSITSSVRANASSGFSVVTYTVGNNTSQTIGHGLGVAPQLIIVKERNQANNWQVYHASLGNGSFLYLNSTNASGSNNLWNNTSPTSTVFSIRSGGSANFYDGKDHVAYCFAPVAGYSSFGSYTGNGSADGPFVYTGFRPRWILFKNSSVGVEDWWLHDTARNTYNVMTSLLVPNSSNAEGTNVAHSVDALSNGFKIRTSAQGVNGSGHTIVYAAFAESPFQYARAR